MGVLVDRRRSSRLEEMTKDELSAEIIKASKAVRKKQLALKMGQSEEHDLLEKHFKPITEPLGKLLRTSKQEPKSEPLSPPTTPLPSPLTTKAPVIPKRTTPVAPAAADKTIAQELQEIAYDPFTEEENEQISGEKSFQQFRDEYQNMLETQPEVVDQFLDQYEMLPKVYIDGLLSDTKGEYDTTTGVRLDPVNNKLLLGRSSFEIDGNDIVLDDIRYKGTAGLYELIFKTNPVGYNKMDEDRYRDILQRTSVHHRNYDPSKQIKGSRSHKYVSIIKPLTFRKRSHTTSGKGHQRLIGMDMIHSSAPYQFVYWDNINELVDRLKLLIASQQAGHTGHTNEISSIVEELREADVIY